MERNMENIISITDLPYLALVQIFSYLSVEEKLKSSEVCTTLKQVSRHSTFWKRIEVAIKSKNNLMSFCKFFTQTPFIQELSLSYQSFSEHCLYDEEKYEINLLFQKLENLYCLSVKYLDITDIVLPKSLMHLNCSLKIYNCEPKSQFFTLLQNCPCLTRLCIDALGPFLLEQHYSYMPGFIEVGNDLIKGYAQTVTSLYIKPFQVQWLPLVANCLELKKLRIGFEIEIIGPRVSYPELNYDHLIGITKLPRLEVLIVDSNFFKKFLEVLEKDCLPEVRILGVTNNRPPIRERELEVISKKIPKLETICLTNEDYNVMKFGKYFKNCDDLQDFCFQVTA